LKYLYNCIIRQRRLYCIEKIKNVGIIFGFGKRTGLGVKIVVCMIFTLFWFYYFYLMLVFQNWQFMHN